MLRNISVALLLSFSVLGLACGGSETTVNTSSNSPLNANGVNINTAVKLDPANMPPGLSATPLPPSANKTPGIPASGAPLPPSANKTPGIPSPEEIKRGVKPGLTPTPGIPDPANIRKQLNQPTSNMRPPAKSDVPMMKSNRKLGGNTQ